MSACGMLKGFNTLFVALGLYTADCGGYMIINAIGDALFMFLPIFLGFTAAKKFNVKPMVGLAIGATMCYPVIQASAIASGMEPLYTLFEGTMFASPVYIEFFGIPIISMDYTSTVIPVILVVYFASICEKLFNKIVPELVKFFFVPMLTLIIALPIGFLLIGPVATFGSTIISETVLSIRDFSPMIAGAVVGLTWQILVIFGLHWGFIPVYINNIMTIGYDNVMMPFFGASFATSAVILAIFFKTKDKTLKEMCIPNFISSMFGVTEPAIYGILLPLKKPFIISCIASGISGAFYGVFNLKEYIMGGLGIFEFTAMIPPDGSMDNVLIGIIGTIIAMVVAFIITIVFYKDKKSENKIKNEVKNDIVTNNNKKLISNTIIYSPLKGKVIELSQIKDAAFASGVLGKGVAIVPEEGKIVSPVDGIVTTIFPTLHAIGITSDDGVEMLIHIGLDTVQLEGKGFKGMVKDRDKITKGQVLIEFDIDYITKEGYCLETPVLVTNADNYLDVISENKNTVNYGESIISIIK